MTTPTPGATDTCVCGVSIAWSGAQRRWVHTDAIPKGLDPTHVAVPDRTLAPELEPRREAPVIRQQVDMLKHLVTALELEEASPEDLRDLMLAGTHIVNAAWTSSVARDFAALTDTLTSWQGAMAPREVGHAAQGD